MKQPMAVLVLLSATLVASSELVAVSAQQPSSSTPASAVIQIGIDLVRLDATVLDHSGKPIMDLRPEDFTLEVDGRKQPVTNAAYFGARAPSKSLSAGSTAMPFESVGPSAPDTVVFLVDDLNMAFGSMFAARQALSAFATDWTLAGSTIAMRLTSDEGKPLTRLRTADELRLAAKALPYNLRTDQGLSPRESPSSVTLVAPERSVLTTMSSEPTMPGSNSSFSCQNKQQRVSNLIATIDSLRSLPGRKAVVFMSEGFLSEEFFTSSQRDDVSFPTPFNSLFDDADLRRTLRMITEVANRASVVVYAIDPRGLTVDAPGAEANVTPEEASTIRREHRLARVESQGSLRQLAGDTGGVAMVNKSVRQGLDDVVRDHRGYYLIGFAPTDATFATVSGRRQFHKIKLSVDRKGVRVRTRAGFYGVTDEEVSKRAPLSSPAIH